MAWAASEPFVKPYPLQLGHHPYVVALTGGIASGKTLVSDEFARLGVPIIDTDVIAHEIVEPGQPALREIENVFGQDIIDQEGRLKRSELRAIIFSNPRKRKILESILHPKIRQKVGEAITRVTSDYCILVIPLLVDRDSYPNVKRVLVVDVESETQISRLMKRDSCTREQALQALAAQPSREKRLVIADDILDNSDSQMQARENVALLHNKYTRLSLLSCNSTE